MTTKKIIVRVVVFVLCLVLSFGVGYGYGTYENNHKEPEPVTVTATPNVELPMETQKRIVTVSEVESKLVEIKEFATFSGEYTVTKGYDYSRHIGDDIKIPGTTKNVTLTCDGLVKVGYDLNDVHIEIDNESRTIYVSLPDAKLLDNYIIWDTVECTEKNNILNPIDFSQYKELISEIEADGLKDVENKGIYNKAEDNMKTIIISVLSGFDDYKVKVL